MTSGDSWLDAVKELWTDIVEGERFPRIVRILLGVVMIIGIFWSIFIFQQMLTTLQGDDTLPPAPDAATDKEIALLEETSSGFRNAVLARAGSTQLTVMASAVGRKPFVPSELPSSTGGTGTEPVQEIILPPMIWVKAVMIQGSNSVAVVDVEGYGDGIIVKKGYSFGEGKGRVLAISHDKVVLTWSGQRIDIPLDR